MWQFSCISNIILLLFICLFAGVMLYDPRTVWSGILFFGMMVWLAVSLCFSMYQFSDWLAEHMTVNVLLVILILFAVVCIIVFPTALVFVFFVEGIRVIRHEGVKPSNLLSILFSLMLYVYLTFWPVIGELGKNTLGTLLYVCVSFSAVYFLSLMAAYSLSAVLNLIHWKKKRNADYIVVLGCGIIGTKVTPLLAARLEKGIELLHCNENAVLILSGGQGAGEDIPESAAMADYVRKRGVEEEKIILEQNSVSTQENLLFSRELMKKPKPEIVVVTTGYHVFRALILARRQGIKCVGFGAKTKWYFALNAFLREFAGYLSLNWKKHVAVMGITAGITAVIYIFL